MGEDHTEQAETWGDITVCRLLYGAIHIAIIIYIPTVTVWSGTRGRYFEAVSETRGWIGCAILLLNISGYVIARCRNLGFFRSG